MLRRRPCSACAGTRACLRCEGWGRVWTTARGRSHCELCPDCNGVGACKLCGRRGKADAATGYGLLRRWAGGASH